MNILRFKDVVLTPTESGLSQAICDTYNEYYKGKYTYCLNWVYCIPLSCTTNSEFVTLSNTYCKKASGEIPYSPLDAKYHSLLYSDIVNYADATNTEKANDIQIYSVMNTLSPDKDITLDELKVFRRWLATTLYSIKHTLGVEENEETRMLKYYALDKKDDTVEALKIFAQATLVGVNPEVVCACTQTTSTLEQRSICDAEKIYKQGVYNTMVKYFREVDYWVDLHSKSNVLIATFKKYIDNIIKTGLPLDNCEYVNMFRSCGCVDEVKKEQEIYTQYLVSLSNALGFILDGTIKDHKAVAATAFFNWASVLYDNMFWA